MADALTYDKKKLKIFEDGIKVDDKLPKWKYVMEEIAKRNKERKTQVDYFPIIDNTSTGSQIITNNANTIRVEWQGTPFDAEEEDRNNMVNGLQFSEIASMGLRELSTYIKEKNIGYYLRATGTYGNDWTVEASNSVPVAISPGVYKETFLTKLKNLFKKNVQAPVPEFDVIQFFSKIKATSKESAEGYVNRVEKYILAINNAKSVGQEALVEKLLREMIANKYESFLAAEGYYHVVTEEQMVEFINKSERGISIDYVKNFVRPIPVDVINKIAEASKLEVFDNYVIVHYDPKGKAAQDTAKDEYKKRRDPIVFGVIAGSHKLYYITDWIDDYCDLTLEKFVDTLKITKDDLVIDETKKAELKKEKLEKEAEKKTAKTTKKPTAKKEKKEEPKKGRKASKKKE